MTNRYLLLTCFLVLVNYAYAQTRFVNDAFENIDNETVAYHENGDPYIMDIHWPEERSNYKRPLLLYVHGGGFGGGERDQPDHIEFCESYARKGYVTVTMDYPLLMKGKSFSCDRPAPEKIKTFLETARAISMATSYLIKNADKYSIDKEKIVLLGSSAGAEAILHAAFWDKTRVDSLGNTLLGNEFKYAGLVNMAGAVVNINWISSVSAIPVISFHGTCDPLVPYGFAPHHYCTEEDVGFLKLYGSKSIHDHLISLGKSSYLVSGCGDGHEWNITPFQKYPEMITEFLYDQVIKNKLIQKHAILPNQVNIECKNPMNYNYCEN